MSILLAVDEAIDARKLIHRMVVSLEKSKLPSKSKSELLDAGYQLYDRIEAVVDELEKVIVPPESTLAVTFMPASEEEMELREQAVRREQERARRRGTLMLPSVPPDEGELDRKGWKLPLDNGDE